jgi:hypothetical protein
MLPWVQQAPTSARVKNRRGAAAAAAAADTKHAQKSPPSAAILLPSEQGDDPTAGARHSKGEDTRCKAPTTHTHACMHARAHHTPPRVGCAGLQAKHAAVMLPAKSRGGTRATCTEVATQAAGHHPSPSHAPMHMPGGGAPHTCTHAAQQHVHLNSRGARRKEARDARKLPAAMQHSRAQASAMRAERGPRPCARASMVRVDGARQRQLMHGLHKVMHTSMQAQTHKSRRAGWGASTHTHTHTEAGARVSTVALLGATCAQTGRTHSSQALRGGWDPCTTRTDSRAGSPHPPKRTHFSSAWRHTPTKETPQTAPGNKTTPRPRPAAAAAGQGRLLHTASCHTASRSCVCNGKSCCACCRTRRPPSHKSREHHMCLGPNATRQCVRACVCACRPQHIQAAHPCCRCQLLLLLLLLLPRPRCPYTLSPARKNTTQPRSQPTHPASNTHTQQPTLLLPTCPVLHSRHPLLAPRVPQHARLLPARA